MEEKMRTFLAIELDRSVKDKLEKIQNMLRDCSLQIKWIEKYNFHLTLKFLGNIEEAKVDEIKEKLVMITDDLKPFELTIEGLGSFPNLNYPKVIWAGIEEGQEELKSLQQRVEKAMVDLGFEEDRHNYTPHITLGRTERSEKNFNLISQKLKQFPFKINSLQEVNKVSLMKSKLTSKGPIYSSLVEVRLDK